MSTTGIPAFDSTLQTTNLWLNDLLDRLGWQDNERAYHALRAVLRALRDHLPVEQTAALAAQLPMLVRGFYYDGWRPADTPVKERKKEAFLNHVAAAFRDTPELNTEHIVRAVFQVLSKHVTPGEIKHIMAALPGEIRSLWTEEPHTVWF